MDRIPKGVEARLDSVYQNVTGRFCSLFESQGRTNFFGNCVVQLVYEIHAEVWNDLSAIREHLPALSACGVDAAAVEERLERVQHRLHRGDEALDLLMQERVRRWSDNVRDLNDLLIDFRRTVSNLSDSLIEKDLLERQNGILQSIVLSHEKVSRWKELVREILTGFYEIFPFNLFVIATAEKQDVSVIAYHNLESLSGQIRTTLLDEFVSQLDISGEGRLDIEEIILPIGEQRTTASEVRMITVSVSVPALDSVSLPGMLGIAFASTLRLTAQEESVIRSILAVMVMVVGSSRALSHTLTELEYFSTHDPLTGLHNRRYFNDILEYEIGRSERHGHEFSILMLDLDDFKSINDSYGHPAGDEVLLRVAETMRAAMRKGDLATRLGGDEFAILLTETGKAGAIKVAEKLRNGLREIRFESAPGRHFHVTTSIGVVSYPSEAQTAADLMAAVDLGLYRAKELGKDGVGTLDIADQHVRANRMTRDYAEELRAAIHEGRIVPYYQPIIDCQTGEVFAYETLSRLKKADGEIVPAGRFIETIEKYGLGRELDRTIIAQALVAVRTRMRAGHACPRVFINLSAQEIQGRGVIGYAEHLCETLHIPPAAIVFEILERDAISDMPRVRTFLSSLRERGFLFALDDFGSGYNSFHYLRELSFDFVKIDGDFVRNILTSETDLALVRNLGRLCRDLGIRCIAEFVESEEICQVLKTMDIDYLQGFHLGMPMQEMSARGSRRPCA